MGKITLDREGARFVRKNNWEVSVPVSVEQIHSNVTLSVYPRLRPLAKRFLKRFEDRPVSDEAIAFLREGGRKYLARRGYVPESGRDGRGQIFRFCFYNMPEEAENCFPLTPEVMETYRNLTEYDLAMTFEDDRLAYVAVEGDAIVAIAATNTSREEWDTYVEVGVETAPDYRRRGYGALCLNHLGAALALEEYGAEGRADLENVGSIFCLRRAGYVRVGYYFDLVGEKT